MQVILKNIIPDFLEKEKVETSFIWDKYIEIKKGEKVQVVAPSGRGKTSLIHFIYGLRKDFSGNILLNNGSVKSFTPTELASIRTSQLSIIFQDLKLFQEHTVYENIEIKRALKSFHNENKIIEMSGRLGIETKLKQICRKCSYGEQQRICIIRALQQPFELLLMDEPFSNLDEINRKKAMELIEEEASARKATLILFDLKEIEYFKPDRILYL